MSFLARLIAIEEFGLLAKVTALTGIVYLFTDLGIVLATIQRKEINEKQLSAFFWINAIVSAFLALLIVICAPLIGWFYDDSRVIGIALVLSCNILLTGLGLQHFAILRRELRFGTIAKVQIASNLIACTASVILALWIGYWALVIQLTLTTLFNTLGAWVFCRFRPQFVIFKTGIRDSLKMGGNFTISKFVNYFARNLDNVLIARYWGDIPLGIYSRAYALLLMPLNQISGPLNQVAVPALSRLQSEHEAFRRFIKRGILIASFLILPVCTFPIVATKEIVLTFLGPNWLECVPIFLALSPKLVFTMSSTATTWIIMSTGRTAQHLRTTVLSSIAIVIGFFASISFGVLALAWTFTVVSSLSRVVTVGYLLRDTPVKPFEIIKWQASAFAVSAIAGGGTVFAGFLLPIENGFLGLLFKATVFGGLYLILGWHSRAARECRYHIMQMLKTKRAIALNA
jgi:O-antigen/teichoic acid export membrane protein